MKLEKDPDCDDELFKLDFNVNNEIGPAIEEFIKYHSSYLREFFC